MPNFKEKNLLKAINSISNQSYENIELIIIDGASGKKTIEILKKKNDEIDLWISEKDNGLWDAWNKGIKFANGDYVGIVDSSNILYKDTINILIDYIKRIKNLDFLCGTIKKNNKIYSGYREKDIYKQFNIIPSSVVGLYVKLSKLKKVGLLNINYKIQSDYDLLYRMIYIYKLKGYRTKSTEIFGDVGDSGYSTKHSFFRSLFNELKIRFDNKQNILILIYILFGRIVLKTFKLFFV